MSGNTYTDRMARDTTRLIADLVGLPRWPDPSEDEAARCRALHADLDTTLSLAAELRADISARLTQGWYPPRHLYADAVKMVAHLAALQGRVTVLLVAAPPEFLEDNPRAADVAAAVLKTAPRPPQPESEGAE